MIDNEILLKLVSVYQSLPKETLSEKGEGWVNMAKLAPALLRAGINYKAMGYEKLGELIYKSNSFWVHTDNSGIVPVKFVKEKVKKQVPFRKPQRLQTQYADSNEISKIKRRLRLENNQFIGQFAPQKIEGLYAITDIRNTDFTKIEDKERGVKNLSISFKSLDREFNRFAYYKFTWVLLDTNPLKFGIDLREEITPIYPKGIVSSLYEGIMRYPAGAAKKIARSLDTLKKQLTQSGKEVFIYELLQNANDYPRHDKIYGEYKN